LLAVFGALVVVAGFSVLGVFVSGVLG